MKEIVCGVIYRDGLYTISRRREGVHQGGKWEFPGGKREADEPLDEALIRECKEELGIIVNSPIEIGDFEFKYGALALKFYVYWVSDYQGDAGGLEGQVVEQVTLNELKKRDFPDANLCIFDMIDEFLGEHNVE